MHPSQQEIIFAPAVEANEVERLEGLLLVAGDWLTAADILRQLGYLVNEANRRLVRAWASHSEVILSGNHGYRHLKFCTIDDVQHFCGSMESQAKTMTERAERVRTKFEELTKL